MHGFSFMSLGLALVISSASPGLQAANGRLLLDCGSAGTIEGFAGFTSIKLDDGQIVRSVSGGEVRTLNGVKLAAVPYSDGSVLYTKATPPTGFFFTPAGGTMVECEIP